MQLWVCLVGRRVTFLCVQGYLEMHHGAVLTRKLHPYSWATENVSWGGKGFKFEKIFVSFHSTMSNRFEKQNTSKSHEWFLSPLMGPPPPVWKTSHINKLLRKRTDSEPSSGCVLLVKAEMKKQHTCFQRVPPSHSSHGLAMWSLVQIKQVAILK